MDGKEKTGTKGEKRRVLGQEWREKESWERLKRVAAETVVVVEVDGVRKPLGVDGA